ncbi:MAG: hypothetical protein BRC28_04095 [Nanohaloarchaea archaeon SW_4_43_9]|nr:MAG: hypothetical protein BRC28_04095 [Nanohaloarchaea archaeon SW_4_43_9]
MDEKTLQEQITEAFEDGGYQTLQDKNLINKNEEELLQRERENEGNPNSETNTYPVVEDKAHEPGLREVGAPVETRTESVEEQAFTEIYRTVGYNADQEGFTAYPVELAGIINIENNGAELEVNYQLVKDRVGKKRDQELGLTLTEEDEIQGLLTPSEHVGVEVESSSDYIEVGLSYSTEELTEGSREAAEKLEEIENYLDVR